MVTFSIFSAKVFAASPVLATEPLSSAATAKPNLMFVLDNSGSMAKNYVSTALNDDLPPLMRHGGQCKAAIKLQPGVVITQLEKDGDKLKIKVASGDFTEEDRVYLAVPNKPQYSGLYKIKESNHVDSVSATCTARNITTTVQVRNPQSFGGTSGYDYYSGPPENRVRNYAVACDPGPSPANSGLFINTQPVRITVATHSCGWNDPADIPVGTDIGCLTWSGGSGSVNGRQLEVELDDDSGADGLLSVTDAYLTMSVDYNTAATPAPVGWYEDSACARYDYWNDDNLYGWEPPQSSAQVNSLFYNPEVSYAPPPWPNKFASAAPANKLPSMTSAYTSNWTKVPKDGLILIAGNPISPASAVTSNLTTTGDMVWCDTPRRPTLKDASNPASGSFASDKEWLESNRCRHNIAASNTVANSSNYPYQYPAKMTGSATASAYFYWSSEPHQHGGY